MAANPGATDRERARRAKGRELDALLRDAVGELGFVRRKGLYFASVADGIQGWLALQVKREGDTFSVYPNVGVRHEELHLTVDRLYGRKPGAEATLVRMLGYLMPENTANVAWEFHATHDPSWAASGWQRRRAR